MRRSRLRSGAAGSVEFRAIGKETPAKMAMTELKKIAPALAVIIGLPLSFWIGNVFVAVAVGIYALMTVATINRSSLPQLAKLLAFVCILVEFALLTCFRFGYAIGFLSYLIVVISECFNVPL
jgi:hypothetical protein